MYAYGLKDYLYKNPDSGIVTFVPRHPEIKDYTAEAIYKQLEVL